MTNFYVAESITDRHQRYSSTRYSIECAHHGDYGTAAGAIDAGVLIKMHWNGTGCRLAVASPEACRECGSLVGVDDSDLCPRCRRRRNHAE